MLYKESNQFIKSALILTIASFVIKILSAAYRVPFQNIVGDVGFYIYQQIYPFYGIAAVLAASGFPIIISKLVAENNHPANQVQLIHHIQAAFFTLVFIGISLFSLFFFGAGMLANLMGDPFLAPLIKTVSFIFLFLPLLTLWRGYFQGKGEMAPTAVSQVAEQIARVSVILILALLLVAKGYNLYEVGRGALFGSLVGAFIGVCLLIFFAIKRQEIKALFVKGLTAQQFYQTARTILIQGTAICVSGMVLILFQLIDSMSLFSLLIETGIPVEHAKSLKGVFDRGQPLIQLGTVVAASFSMVLVPLVTSAWKQGEVKLLQEKTQSALKLSIIIGAGASAGLANIIRPTNIMLFENTAGSAALAILSVSIFFSSLILVCAAVLQGLGHVFTPSKYILVGLAFKYACNYILVPSLGIIGAAIATIGGLAIITVLLVRKLYQKVIIMPVLEILPKLILAVCLMTISLQIWLAIFAKALDGRLTSAFLALSGVMLGAAVYLAVILSSGLLNKDEVGILPFGNKLNRLVKIKRRR